ncbi:MAG TPA: heavy metal translocating P-type ATPase [Candidatus Paceibacterota bacterium]
MHTLFRPEFRLPFGVFALLLAGFIPGFHYAWLIATAIGISKISWDSILKIRGGNFSLDYIALLAMVVAIVAGEYLAGAVVSLMITGGEALDEYASRRAEGALRALLEKIPKTCHVRKQDGTTEERPLQEINSGETIIVRANELVALDGTLKSEEALLNEANLTGEALPVTFRKGAFIKSGAVNVGGTIELVVEGTFESSTYMKIVHLVDEAKHHQPRVVKLAEKVNFPFTAITLLLAGVAYFYTGEMARALAVLVIATPCPLLIAAPVAFIGGLSRAARKNIIVKRPVSLEEISRARTIFFDKTGTLTLGEPHLSKIDVLGDKSELELLAIAAAIEFHSIHPLARAVCAARAARGAPLLESTVVKETIGKGIEGEVGSARYRINKSETGGQSGIVLGVFERDTEIGRLHFDDVIKENVGELFEVLKQRNMDIEILTGDRRENAERLFGGFGITIQAQQTPETKFAVIDEAKSKGSPVIMVGDGLNDAPALAHADVGIVFSGTENSAAIEAADAVILSGDVRRITDLLDTAKRSMRIARQSIWVGIGLSVIGMILAALGYIPPVVGALLQEVIDIAVILNSLRAAME